MAGIALNRSRQVPAEQTPAFGGIAERFRKAGDLDRAIALCRDGLTRFPNLLSARVTLGWSLLDKGEYEAARAELEQVLKRAPDNLAAIRGLAELHERAESSMPNMDGSASWHQPEEHATQQPATVEEAKPQPARTHVPKQRSVHRREKKADQPRFEVILDPVMEPAQPAEAAEAAAAEATVAAKEMPAAVVEAVVERPAILNAQGQEIQFDAIANADEAPSPAVSTADVLVAETSDIVFADAGVKLSEPVVDLDVGTTAEPAAFVGAEAFELDEPKPEPVLELAADAEVSEETLAEALAELEVVGALAFEEPGPAENVAEIPVPAGETERSAIAANLTPSAAAADDVHFDEVATTLVTESVTDALDSVLAATEGEWEATDLVASTGNGDDIELGDVATTLVAGSGAEALGATLETPLAASLQNAVEADAVGARDEAARFAEAPGVAEPVQAVETVEAAMHVESAAPAVEPEVVTASGDEAQALPDLQEIAAFSAVPDRIAGPSPHADDTLELLASVPDWAAEAHAALEPTPFLGATLELVSLVTRPAGPKVSVVALEKFLRQAQARRLQLATESVA